MVKKVLLFSSLFAAFLGFAVISAQTVPDHTEFTADRMVCDSKELDYKCIYGHRPGTDEGISVVERPSLKLAITYHYQGKELLTVYVSDNGKTTKVNLKDSKEAANFNQLIRSHFPKDLQEKFGSALQECRKQQKAQ